jgi:hypothetical protein
MRFVGNRSKQWSGYVILALTVAAAWLTRNRPRYRSRFPYTDNTQYGGAANGAQGSGRPRVYDTGGAQAAATATAATAGAAPQPAASAVVACAVIIFDSIACVFSGLAGCPQWRS